MAISIKNEEQIAKMRESCSIVAEVLKMLEAHAKVGVTTGELDTLAEKYIISRGATPSFKGYRGYPASICASINEEVIHGIPGNRKLLSGDVLSVDVGAYKNGYHGDAARTFAVGEISAEHQNLIDVTRQCFFEGIKFAHRGNHLHEISAAIQSYVEQHGYSVVRDYVGHGIGKAMHEDPQIPNYKTSNRGPRLATGMTLAIEPMVNIGTFEVKILRDQWTVVTRDRKASAHYENTILITDAEPQILTLYEG